MTNRLELNWKLDGFVDEQRYYCSETPIDPINLPSPKVILDGDLRSYIDTDIDIGKTYYICISSVKGSAEKLGVQKTVSTISNSLEQFVVFYAPFTEDFNDTKGLSPIVSGPAVIDSADGAIEDGCLYANQDGRIRFDIGNVISEGVSFCFELYLKAGIGSGAVFGLFSDESEAVGTVVMSGNGRLYISRNGFSWWLNGLQLPRLFDNEWHHLAISHNGTAVNIFIDGILSESYSLSGGITQAFNEIILGSAGGVTGYYYPCRIQHARLTVGHSRYEEDFLPPTVF